MVLIIDDEHALQEVMAEIMELAGLSSICASSGEEGAALYAEQYKDIGIVFLDMNLPGMGGHATLAALRQVDPTIPVVIMSGQPESSTMAAFSGQQHLSYLEKPFTLDTLMAKIDSVRNG